MDDLESRLKKNVYLRVTESAKRNGFENGFNSDTPFLEMGLMDSLGFVNLLTDIEEEFSIELDFSDYDPDEFGTVNGFVRCVLGQQVN